MKKIFNVATLIWMIAAPLSANADLLRFNFTGSISFAGSFLDPTGNFSQGQSLDGFWLVETTTADTSVEIGRGNYPQVGMPAFQINIGSSVFQTDSARIQILNDFTLGGGVMVDAYDVIGQGPTSNIPGLSLVTMHILLRDFIAPLDVFDSKALPATAPDLAAFNNAAGFEAQLSGDFGGELFFMNLEIDSVSAVPVPAAVWLFGSALLGLFGVRRIAR